MRSVKKENWMIKLVLGHIQSELKIGDKSLFRVETVGAANEAAALQMSQNCHRLQCWFKVLLSNYWNNVHVENLEISGSKLGPGREFWGDVQRPHPKPCAGSG